MQNDVFNEEIEIVIHGRNVDTHPLNEEHDCDSSWPARSGHTLELQQQFAFIPTTLAKLSWFLKACIVISTVCLFIIGGKSLVNYRRYADITTSGRNLNAGLDAAIHPVKPHADPAKSSHEQQAAKTQAQFTGQHQKSGKYVAKSTEPCDETQNDSFPLEKNKILNELIGTLPKTGTVKRIRDPERRLPDHWRIELGWSIIDEQISEAIQHDIEYNPESKFSSALDKFEERREDEATKKQQEHHFKYTKPDAYHVTIAQGELTERTRVTFNFSKAQVSILRQEPRSSACFVLTGFTMVNYKTGRPISIPGAHITLIYIKTRYESPDAATPPMTGSHSPQFQHGHPYSGQSIPPQHLPLQQQMYQQHSFPAPSSPQQQQQQQQFYQQFYQQQQQMSQQASPQHQQWQSSTPPQPQAQEQQPMAYYKPTSEQLDARFPKHLEEKYFKKISESDLTYARPPHTNSDYTKYTSDMSIELGQKIELPSQSVYQYIMTDFLKGDEGGITPFYVFQKVDDGNLYRILPSHFKQL